MGVDPTVSRREIGSPTQLYYHEGRAALRHYSNQTARPLWILRRRPNFTFAYRGVGAFNQEKARVGAFSVIVQLHLIVYSTTDYTGPSWTVTLARCSCSHLLQFNVMVFRSEQAAFILDFLKTNLDLDLWSHASLLNVSRTCCVWHFLGHLEGCTSWLAEGPVCMMTMSPMVILF